MTSDKVLSAVLKELAALRQVDIEKLTAAVAGGKGFYGEGEIPVPEKEGTCNI